MKYGREKLSSTYSADNFVFFWGHTPAKSGEITQSCLSQWWKCNFTESGINFCCAEQYMMYKKALLFKDHEHADEILKAKEPKTIKALGRMVTGFDDKVWNEHKAEIVLQGNSSGGTTCLYLCISFLTFQWWITWIIWPIAGVVHKLIINLNQE